MTNKLKIKKIKDLENSNDINYINHLNTYLKMFLDAGKKLDYELDLKTDDKGKIIANDIFTQYFLNYPVVVSIKQIFENAPDLKYYSYPNDKLRKYNSYGQGKVSMCFTQLVELTEEEKEILQQDKKVGKPVLIINGKKTASRAYTIGVVCDKNGVKAPANSKAIQLTEDSYISFGMKKELITQAKFFYVKLCKIKNLRKASSEESLINLFSQIYPYQTYLKQALNNSLVQKLEGEELTKYKQLVAYKYSTLRNIIIKQCLMLHSKLNEITAYVDNKNLEVAIGEIDAELEPEFYNFTKKQNKVTTQNIGIPYYTHDKLRKLKIIPIMEAILKSKDNNKDSQRFIDLSTDIISDILANSLANKSTVSFTKGDVFKLSNYKQLNSQAVYNLALEFKDVIKPMQIAISKYLLDQELKKADSKLMVLLDSTLISSATKSILDNSITLDKDGIYSQCFKFSLMQTSNGIPLIMESSSSSIKDVNNFISSVDTLKKLNIDLDRIVICADAGYFSKENLAYAQMHNLDFLMLARHVKVVEQSLLSFPKSHIITQYNRDHKLSIFSSTIKFSQYLDIKEKYLSNPQDCKQSYVTDPNIHKILEDKLKIVHMYNVDVYKTEVTMLQTSFKDFMDQHDGVKDLKDVKASKFKSCLITNEEGNLEFNDEKIGELLSKCGFNSIISNMVNVDDEQLAVLYKMRMYIESSFKTLKTYFDMKPFRKHTNISKDLKCLLSWLTLIVYNSLKSDVKEIKNKQIQKLQDKFVSDEYSTADDLLSKLHSGLTVTFTGSSARPEYRITNTQAKRALQILGLPDPKEYNYGAGFVEQSSHLKKYQKELNKLALDLENNKITQEQYNQKIALFHAI